MDVAALVAASNAAQPRGGARANVAPTLAGLQMVRRAPPEVTVAIDAAPPAEAAGGGPTPASSAVTVAMDSERVCRVCLVGDGDADGDDPTGPLVELRCACRGGMRLAHAVCAEKWFLSKGTLSAHARLAPSVPQSSFPFAMHRRQRHVRDLPPAGLGAVS